MVVIETRALRNRSFIERNSTAQVFVLGAKIEVQVKLAFWVLVLPFLGGGLWSAHSLRA